MLEQKENLERRTRSHNANVHCQFTLDRCMGAREYLRDHEDGHKENLSKAFGSLLNLFQVELFILKLTFLIMVLCMTSYLFLHSFLTQLHRLQTWIFTTFSFGIVWIMVWSLFQTIYRVNGL